jgi:hypothetical protein
MKRRSILLVTSALMLVALMMAVSGAALAQGDVSVSNKGETKVQKGISTCGSDSTSHAVAHNDSEAFAVDDSNAKATNDSSVMAVDDGNAQAHKDSFAGAFGDCTATAQNGEDVTC